MIKTVTMCGWIVMFAVLSVSVAADELQVNYQEYLQNPQFTPTHSHINSKHLTSQTGYRFSFEAFDRVFRLDLANNSALKNENTDSSFQILKGALSDVGDSWVRLSRQNGHYRGVIFDGTEYFWLEPDTDGNTIIFRSTDVTWPELACGLDDKMTFNPNTLFQHGGIKTLPKTSKTLTVSLVTGQQYRADYGSQAMTDMLAAFNVVDGLFSSQLNIQLEVVESPHTLLPDSDGETALEQLADLRDRHPSFGSSGVTHLYTSIDMSIQKDTGPEDIVGIAYIDTLCSDKWAVGLTEVGHRFVQSALVTAHELGHNFGAVHDGTEQCSHEPTNRYLMSAQYAGSNQFSQCSLNVLRSQSATAICLAPTPLADLRVVSKTATMKQARGTRSTVEFELNNNGNIPLGDTEVLVSVDGDIVLEGALVTGGSCSGQGQSLTCQINAIASNQTLLLTVDTLAESDGYNQIFAAVSAANDSDPNNNLASTSIVVSPGTDLSLETSSTQKALTHGDTTGIDLTITNQAPITADDLVFSLAVPNVVRLQDVSISRGSCQSLASSLECTLLRLESDESVRLDLVVEGIQSGSGIMSATIQSEQPDLNSEDNAVSLTFTVTNTGVSGATSAEGGGGGVGMFIYGLLGLTLLWRRKKHYPEA